MQKFTRRRFLTVAAAVPLAGILTRPAGAAEFTLKFANGQDPTHPVNKRAAEAFERIKTATNGRVEINLFPSGQLGSDTDLLGQVRNGAIDYLNLSSSVLAILVPAAGIINTGFAFTSSDQVWTAMDGGLGAYVLESRRSASFRSANLGKTASASSRRPRARLNRLTISKASS